MSRKLSSLEKEIINSKVIEALKNVYDPEIPINIYDLGLVYMVEVDDEGRVKIDMTLTAPGCPIATMILSSVESSIRESIPEVSDVKINLVWDPPWTPLRITPQGREALKKLLGYDLVEEWTKHRS
ncbi:MAG: iron-sulfur cluster assembly protein [Aigarchaeota archaeon]|nr:iron-sulfur cluster assembly protein [Aigarchaeota archaeon]MCX8192679.1 iron-sulfur cluster assembly protein [Nitrososphaeria archaeon]MDW7985638.1 iron-sulfur cluster assembly protein [Nitrososphaerota archaeon]